MIKELDSKLVSLGEAPSTSIPKYVPATKVSKNKGLKSASKISTSSRGSKSSRRSRPSGDGGIVSLNEFLSLSLSLSITSLLPSCCV